MTIKAVKHDVFKSTGNNEYGWNTLCTARLIVPIDERDDFDEDPTACEAPLLNDHHTTHARARYQEDMLLGVADKSEEQKRLEADAGFPSFIFPVHQTFTESEPFRGIFKSPFLLEASAYLLRVRKRLTCNILPDLSQLYDGPIIGEGSAWSPGPRSRAAIS